ncbi:universal stress protein [Oceaniglobus roseus]|uniref:universal stress protein n=1 Tax=Oceaniglobus roseus TaxID=1737570 RepID=UPI000C7F6BFC|nr:universal stress protein [Kandeliimicrobium roseum]
MTYDHIMVPVDLEHADRLGKAIDTAKDLARQSGAKLTFVAVTSELPGRVAHSPEEFDRKLAGFAERQAEGLDAAVGSKSYVAHDPAVEIDDILHDATRDLGADLVVMASHVPNVADAIWPSHGGKMASKADVSVFIVR